MKTLTVILCLGCAMTAAVADPCGMVPPIFAGEGPPITRIGLQKTYVFYQNGIESIVIRPGFSGKVEDFGMLIPFPNPPALRKLPDTIFPQLAAAVDPPEVVEYLWVYEKSMRLGGMPSPDAVAEPELSVASVRVLREEAVGMYEIAVLEAGSAAALQRWMDEHGYVYPKGMDAPCEDYVEDGWCFVAVKTRVGPKAGVDPQPGQRDTAPGLPAGGAFDGHVQAMGFRFESSELVVPMRLSAFNDGELRNVVYVLSDQPLKLAGMPETFVRRQLAGTDLLRNLRALRPLRLVGGTLEDLSLARWKQLLREREPGPVNGLAAELFASDLLAVSAERLSHPHEEHEKVLLNIGEHLGLRGEAVDRLHQDALAEERNELVEHALDALAGMTLTVIDADFPREKLATENLRFERYAMAAEANTSSSYNAPQFGAAPANEGERVEDSALPDEFRKALEDKSAAPRENNSYQLGWLLLVPGLWWALRKRLRRPDSAAQA